MNMEVNSHIQKRIDDWHGLMNHLSGTDLEKIQRVNEFFNKMDYVSDMDLWQANDYWAAPLEFVRCGGGDCEDFAIAKYYTLVKVGVDVDKLRIVYVKELMQNQNHVVLAYYEKEGSDPLILDILTDMICPLSARKDLQFVFEFNERFVWVSGNRYCGEASRITPWKKLMSRIETDQALAKNTKSDAEV